jgi:cbb3-type cytochrome oxidase maturation protein
MEILYLLIPLAVIFLVIAVGFFLWTIRSGQYDDMEGPAYRILMDDDDPMIPGRRPPAQGEGEGQGEAQSSAPTGRQGCGKGEARQEEGRDTRP